MEEGKWRLKRIDVRYVTYGEFEGQYKGKIEFEKGDDDAFTFSLNSEKTKLFLDLIACEVVNTASDLGDKLIESLGLEIDKHE